jgi:hypothetical protein
VIDPAGERQVLHEYALELDELSKMMAYQLRELEPIQADAEKWEAEFETRLWKDHVQHGEKLPSEKIRQAMIATEMPRDLAERHKAALAEVRRLKDRISVLKELVDAHRSILSALKAEQEATG